MNEFTSHQSRRLEYHNEVFSGSHELNSAHVPAWIPSLSQCLRIVAAGGEWETVKLENGPIYMIYLYYSPIGYGGASYLMRREKYLQGSTLWGCLTNFGIRSGTLRLYWDWCGARRFLLLGLMYQLMSLMLLGQHIGFILSCRTESSWEGSGTASVLSCLKFVLWNIKAVFSTYLCCVVVIVSVLFWLFYELICNGFYVWYIVSWLFF